MYNNTSTIKAMIQNGKEEKMTSNQLSLKTAITNSSGQKFVVNLFNLFEKYYDILLDNTVTLVLTEDEYLKYRFKPKLLSKDLYGSKDLYYLLIRLNNIYTVIEFDFKEIKVFNTNIVSLLNEIMILESENYIENELSVIKEINE
jgi:hypothetical protein